MQICDGPNQSPADMFGFKMLVYGLHGNYSADMNITDKELEVYGVDWAALQNEQLLQSV